MIQGNGKVSCVHRLGKVKLLKCPYYPQQSTDLIW